MEHPNQLNVHRLEPDRKYQAPQTVDRKNITAVLRLSSNRKSNK